jgi:protein phosphatase PTC7
MMQATIGTLSRIVSRSLVSGVVERVDVVSQKRANVAGGQDDKTHHHLTTAVSGFPKAKNGQYNIENILKGQIGDDAYFIARHIDDWNNNSLLNNDTDKSPEQLLNPEARQEKVPVRPTGEVRNNSADVIGVADGVGGWRAYGVDPGLFSLNLMRSCERLVKAGYFISDQPAQLLASGFREMQESKRPVIGSSTACLAILSHADGKLYTANIGDSGFLVVRDGKVVHRSHEQQHYFNTPFQLSLPPSNMAADVLSDAPESADRYEFSVEDGDVIVLATDGVFDNIPDSLLVAEIGALQTGSSTPDPARIQACANSIALIARKLSQDESFLSPFAKNARTSGFFNVSGGKEDDVTVILAAVSLKDSERTT